MRHTGPSVWLRPGGGQGTLEEVEMTKHDGSRCTLAVLAALAASACSSPSSLDRDLLEEADQVAARDEQGIHLLVQLEDLDAYPSALYRGGLEVDAGGCIRLAESTGPTTVLWPKGFRARTVGGRIDILDPQGDVVGRTGQELRMGGGGVPSLHEGLGFTAADQALAVSRCPGGFWLVTPGTVATD